MYSLPIYAGVFLVAAAFPYPRPTSLHVYRLKRMLEDEEAQFIQEAAQSIETPLERQVRMNSNDNCRCPQRHYMLHLLTLSCLSSASSSCYTLACSYRLAQRIQNTPPTNNPLTSFSSSLLFASCGRFLDLPSLLFLHPAQPSGEDARACEGAPRVARG